MTLLQEIQALMQAFLQEKREFNTKLRRQL